MVRSMNSTTRKQLVWCALLLLAFLPSATVCFYAPDEGRYAEVAREMMVTGDFLTPRFHGVPHLTKPPMAYWGAALGMSIWGVGPFGARFVPAVLWLLSVLLVFDLGRRLFDREVGLRAGFMFALSPLPFLLGHVLSADVFVTFFQIATVTLAVAAWQQKRRLFVWGFWIALALAFLSKGPPGLLCTIPIIFMAWRRRGKGRVLCRVAPILLFVLLSLSWYLLLVAQDMDRARYFLVDEVFNRIFSSSHGRENPRWMYAVCLTAGVLPWMAGYLRVFQGFRSWWRKPDRQATDQWSLLAVWFFVPLLIFLLSRSRMILYVAPLTVPLLIAFAALWPRPLVFGRRSIVTALAIVAFLMGTHQVLRDKGYGKEAPALASLAREVHEGTLPVFNGTGRRLGCIGLSFQPEGPVPRLPFPELLAARSLPDLQRLMGNSGPVWLVIRNKHLPHLPSLPSDGLHVGRLGAYLIPPSEVKDS